MALACAANRQTEQETTPPPPEVQMPEFLLHRVLPGETMASIAKWYTGKESDWRELAQHNPDLKPWNLKRGDLVKIPREMATAHTNQPEHSTAPKKHRKATQKAAPAKDTAPAEPEEVFGPK
jgi:DNA-directed RNA polymerase subunit H (RpoH/RPB5)